MLNYSVVIRTLGKAGSQYQATLESLLHQTIKPLEILVYLANSYPQPSETIGLEKYIYVPKGMVSQRALTYDEVQTQYCLFLDDDVYLPPTAVEKMYLEMMENDAQVISPCTFNNQDGSLIAKIVKTLTGKEVCRLNESRWAFKVLGTAGFSYNNSPQKSVYESQSNAGPCFFCRKEDFLKIAFQEELWLDAAPYALPEDQVMYYKMYKKGLKVLTTFDTGVIHLDAGSTLAPSHEKMQKLIFSEYRNKLIFWHRFLYLPERRLLHKLWALVAIGYSYGLQTIKHSVLFVIGKKDSAMAFLAGVRDAICYLRSEEYKNLPLI